MSLLMLSPLGAENDARHDAWVVTSVLSFFLFVFSGCYKITTVFSHAQTVVLCVGCSTVLCQPTGGKARLTEGQS